ncbi:MAG: hypothetical protein ACOVOV_09620, partial [Dolichospermum sp.]
MAVNIKLKRSGVSGRLPTTSSLELGEIALNTYDGRAFMKIQTNTTTSIVEFATTAGSGSSVVSASYALTASFASYAANAGNAATANFATSASYALNSTSASYAFNATSASYTSNALSASYAETSSYASNFNVSGNLVVQGVVTTLNTAVAVVEDPLLKLGNANPADSLDLGFF